MAYKLPSIEVHNYKTPTALNSDGTALYSLGILNLTAEEAREISTFARVIREQIERRTALRATLNLYPEERRRDALYGAEAIDRAEMAATMMRDALGDDREEIERQAAREPEPDEPRNRFSGLDLT